MYARKATASGAIIVNVFMFLQQIYFSKKRIIKMPPPGMLRYSKISLPRGLKLSNPKLNQVAKII